MSYDGWLVIDTGAPEPAEIAELGNYTSNVSPMWRTALAAAGEEIRLSDTDGRNAADVLPLLNAAVEHMADNPDLYRSMNPLNKWGDYEGAFDYLRNVADLCAKHPDGLPALVSLMSRPLPSRVRAVLERRRSNAAGPHRAPDVDVEPCLCGTGFTCLARVHDDDPLTVEEHNR